MTKPLLEKSFEIESYDYLILRKVILKNDVVDTLRKFKEGDNNCYSDTMQEIEGDNFKPDLCKCNYPASFQDKEGNCFCFKCWVKECFGILPKEEKK